MSLSRFILFVLFAFISTKNVVIIGDSRVCGFAYSVLGIPYTWHNDVYGTGSYIISSSAKSYNGHSIKVIAEVGASHYTFTNSNKAVYSAVYQTLSNAASGTVVLLWLGVNNLDSTGVYSYYQSLAKKYKGLKFFAVSVSGVSSKSGISNQTIKTFNTNLSKKVSSSGLSNLVYKSILKDGNPVQIYNVATKTVTFYVSDSTTDYYGVHYTGKGDKEVLNAMLALV